jgi:dihydrofolate reductase
VTAAALPLSRLKLDKTIPAAFPLTLVVASTPTGIIGNEGAMPWRLGSDLARFKKMTMGGTLVMGRRTFDSIGRPLPGRQTVVLTRQQNWQHPGVRSCQSAIEAVQAVEEIGTAGFVVGGAEIYQLLFPYVQQIWLTVVWAAVHGDTRVDLPRTDFQLVEVSRYPQTSRDTAPTELQKWVRKKSVPKTQVPIEF